MRSGVSFSAPRIWASRPGVERWSRSWAPRPRSAPRRSPVCVPRSPELPPRPVHPPGGAPVMTQQEDPPQPVEAAPAPLEGLPKDALRRLAELQGKDALFTSDLSVNEFLLVKEAGFHPRGLVVGSSIYHIGFSSKGWSSSEVQTLTQAMYAARELAMSRMEEEADVLGADGIVGVRLDVGFYEWGRGTAEFLALGTAVSAEDGGNWKTPAGKPFTSDLSGQDFWTLLQAGHAPLGLVMGTCVFHVAHQGMFKAMGNIG